MPDDAAGSESTRIHDSCARHLFPAVEVYQRPNGSTTGELARQGYEYDTLGRLIHERRLVPEPEGSPFWVGRTTTRDAQGWVEMVSEWGTTDHGTTYEDFDPFGRPGTVTLADGSVISRSYEGVSSVEETTQVWSYVGTTAQNALTTVRNVNDRHGRLVRTEEIGGVAQGGVTTKYAYDVGGRLADVQLHVAGYNPGFFQQRQFDYDNRGFLLAERVPEKGAAGNGWVYYSDYDAMGNVGRKSDGDVELVSRWDGAGRLRSVEASSGCASDIPVSAYSYVDATGKLGTAVTFNYYDGIEGTCSGSKMLQGDEIFSDGFEDGTTDAWSGSLSSEDSLPVVHTYVYGGRGGRLSSVVTSVGDDDFTQGYAWDELGNLSQLTYPDLAGYTEPAEALGTVTNSYTLGHLTAVPEFASSIKYHSNGDLKAIWRTNGRYDAFWLDQHSMGRPRRINAAVLDTRAVVWSTGEYQYDGSGNVKQVGSNEFVYDGLHRLVHGEVDDGTVSQDYVYDGLGNLVEITETSGVPETRTISVDHTTNRLSGGTTYDSVGNLTSWGGFNYSWRVTGEMRARTGPGINKWFGYDAGGERVVVEDKITGKTTFTLRNLDGKVLRVFEKDGATWTWTKDYVYRGELLLASRDTTGTLHFTLDHLGTPRYVLDQNGLNPVEHEYFGFGEEATTTGLDEPMKFTGHERDLEGTPDRLDDLDYMHARYYSPVLARFLSVDPVMADTSSSQSWNRYSYVINNPVRLVDPNGEDWLDILNGAANGFGSTMLANAGRVTPTNRDFQAGQTIGDIAATAVGMLEIIAGSGGEAGGGALVLSGVGAPEGAVALAGSTALVAHGSVATTTGVANLLEAPVFRNGNSNSSGAGEISEVFDSIYSSGNVPDGWQPAKGGTLKVNVKNKPLLEKLREVLPGRWKKVYRKGVDGTEIHYFEHESGKVFNVKTK
jgi:RHS repeat-associated protein